MQLEIYQEVLSLIRTFTPTASLLPFYRRTATIDCLTEIASLPPHDIPSQYHPAMQALLVHLVQSLLEIIPPSADLRRAFENGSDEDCLFVKRLALLLGKSFICVRVLLLVLRRNYL